MFARKKEKREEKGGKGRQRREDKEGRRGSMFASYTGKMLQLAAIEVIITDGHIFLF